MDRARSSLMVLVFVSAACGGGQDGRPVDGPADAGRADAGAIDAGIDAMFSECGAHCGKLASCGLLGFDIITQMRQTLGGCIKRCDELVVFQTDISGGCGQAQKDYLACLAPLSCEVLEADTGCPDEQAALNGACSP